MSKISPNGKLLAGIALLPIVADFLEDAVEEGIIRFEAKKKANETINKIRSFDEFIMRSADPEAVEQQVDIQRAFRQWLEVNFTEDE